ncbi:MAG: ATP-binding protein [Kiloniellaceae bacterium]
MKPLIPDTIATRTLLVLIVGLTLSHVLSIALYFTDRSSALLFTGGEHVAERIATLSQLAESTATPDERQRIVEIADSTKLHILSTGDGVIDDQLNDGWQAGVLRGALASHFNSNGKQDFRLVYTEGALPKAWREHLNRDHEAAALGEALLVSLPLRDGSWLNFAAPIQSPEPFWSLRFALSMVVMLSAVAILSTLVVHHLTRPLGAFARAAQRLGVDVKAPPLPETGPAEVRQAAQAFNDMQERLRRFIEDRTQMLAAISHDLGTPITRLRLRAEFVDDEQQQKKMLADLDDMERMVASALSFARDEATSEPHAMVDLRSILQRICDDMTDAGYRVDLTAAREPIPLGCRPVALRRALTNLVENAVKYGGQAQVSIAETDDNVVVRIDDDGPGIQDDLQEAAFKPFRRLEGSRSRETGGTGLGLTVSRTIARAHGGDVYLKNRSQGGLRAEVKLPR